MDLNGKTIVITGGTSGIGQAVARRLSAHAATLIVHGPQPQADVAGQLQDLRRRGSARVEYIQTDFTHLAEVATTAERIRSLGRCVDVLINNAVAAPSTNRIITADGYEKALQVNYLAMVALTAHLAGDVRDLVVNIASETHRSAHLDLNDLQLEHGYSAPQAYYRSKLAIVTYTEWLAALTGDRGPRVIAICPGLTDTPLLRAMFPGTSAATPAHAAGNVVAGIVDDLPTGTYTHDGRIMAPSDTAADADFQHQLMARTSGLLGLALPEILTPQPRTSSAC